MVVACVSGWAYRPGCTEHGARVGRSQLWELYAEVARPRRKVREADRRKRLRLGECLFGDALGLPRGASRRRVLRVPRRGAFEPSVLADAEVGEHAEVAAAAASADVVAAGGQSFADPCRHGEGAVAADVAVDPADAVRVSGESSGEQDDLVAPEAGRRFRAHRDDAAG